MKKQRFPQLLSATVMAIFSYFVIANSAIAHPGHDHAANESMLMHILFYGSIALAIVVCGWFVYRQFAKQKK